MTRKVRKGVVIARKGSTFFLYEDEPERKHVKDNKSREYQQARERKAASAYTND